MNRLSSTTLPSYTERYPIDGFNYRLLDSGNGRKLEQFGAHRFIRPAPQAIWPARRAKEEWDEAVSEYTYSKGKDYGGEWHNRPGLPKDAWRLTCQDLIFEIKPTGFGHMGLFPEQAAHWLWIRDFLKSLPDGHPKNVLNIFGYTGASTLAAAAGGASVAHVDSSKASVNWARKNLEISGLGDRTVRWYVDDVLKFLKREHNRERFYEGIILDPPTFGRGAKGEVWKIEKDLPQLLQRCRNVLSREPRFILFTTHSPGFSALTLKNMMLNYLVEPNSGQFDAGEMYLHNEEQGYHIPSGFYSLWWRD